MALKNDDVNYGNLDCYLLNEQPTTCAICGARTNFEEVNDGIQIHKCMNSNCDYKFTAEVDEYLVNSEN
tara:strand:- start:1114 stop:1320 length:207 start_codon:yes stop_codon:yes gene_type:complete